MIGNGSDRPGGDRPLETRTTGSGLERQTYTLCGRPIKGRRRNGFCSDRCRMRTKRQEAATRLEKMVRSLETITAELREELLNEK
jgi:predicted nucleic acid-binding Zn ribbon protein